MLLTILGYGSVLLIALLITCIWIALIFAESYYQQINNIKGKRIIIARILNFIGFLLVCGFWYGVYYITPFTVLLK